MILHLQNLPQSHLCVLSLRRRKIQAAHGQQYVVPRPSDGWKQSSDETSTCRVWWSDMVRNFQDEPGHWRCRGDTAGPPWESIFQKLSKATRWRLSYNCATEARCSLANVFDPGLASSPDKASLGANTGRNWLIRSDLVPWDMWNLVNT